MKSKLCFLIIGVAVGLYLRSFWSTPQATVEIEEAQTTVSPVQRSPSRVVEAAPKIEEFTSFSSGVEVAATTNPSPALETTRGLIINEKNVAEMERHRDDLRNYGYTTQTTEGWKIEILPDDKVFRKAGLSSGDLITFESMDRQLQMPERAQLANRMVELLNSIQQ